MLKLGNSMRDQGYIEVMYQKNKKDRGCVKKVYP